MTTNHTILLSDLDPSSLRMKFFKSPDGYVKRVYINHLDKPFSQVKLQLCNFEPDCMMQAPFGVSDPMPGFEYTGRFSVELKVSDSELSKRMRELDDECVKFAHAHCAECFEEELDIDEVRERLTSPYREKDKNKLLRIKVPIDGCEILRADTFDTVSKKIACERDGLGIIEKGVRIIPIVTLSSVWFMESECKFGYSLVATNIVVDYKRSFYMTGAGYKHSQRYTKRGMPIHVSDMKLPENTLAIDLRGRKKKKKGHAGRN